MSENLPCSHYFTFFFIIPTVCSGPELLQPLVYLHLDSSRISSSDSKAKLRNVPVNLFSIESYLDFLYNCVRGSKVQLSMAVHFQSLMKVSICWSDSIYTYLAGTFFMPNLPMDHCWCFFQIRIKFCDILIPRHVSSVFAFLPIQHTVTNAAVKIVKRKCIGYSNNPKENCLQMQKVPFQHMHNASNDLEQITFHSPWNPFPIIINATFWKALSFRRVTHCAQCINKTWTIMDLLETYFLEVAFRGCSGVLELVWHGHTSINNKLDL